MRGFGYPIEVSFVDWRKLNAFFCGVMWVVVLVLAVVIMAHALPGSSAPPHPIHAMMR